MKCRFEYFWNADNADFQTRISVGYLKIRANLRCLHRRYLRSKTLIALIACAGCARQNLPSAGGTITKEGFIDCFEDNLKAGDKPVWCEASAVLYDGQKLLVANDKEMPDARTSVFYYGYPFDSTQQPVYWPDTLLKKAQKYEDFSLSPDGKHAFLLTAFDRVKPNSSDWDGYNALIYWNTANPKKLRVAHTQADETFSMGLRQKISQILRSEQFPAGVPYFKIEGLAATATHLYFGVREEGESYNKFQYEGKIVGVSYQFTQDSLAINTDFEVVTTFDFAAMQPHIIKPLGLSSIEYDAKRKLFWVLTSHENKEQIGAYLWWATAEDFKKGQLNLVNNRATGQPLYLNHKAEDLTILPDGRLFIIHDDDRFKTTIGSQIRQPHQAAYTIIKF
ncbi:MAG: hypothetical protein EAZ70_06750 [Runella slithyformis]|nr:MAG: hypothetical protein EAY79_04480 [Runella slithyformis]TAF02548.1 MAG: hypothetical protein EAZ80_00940 [Runella slithyformis]TAF27579.1 MAG: hypothetical protein EAZ70_06750 [Runella slithyformis]TAF49761.1 MAG: hypothetical protein EAZ63_00500 [Runella slithyformis]TAF79058.1 MAG: hypothetical protein EAZ50_12340 [Runella slithyformis]